MARIIRFPQSGRHDLSCTNGTNSTISASGSTIFLVIRALKIVSSTCRYRIIRVIRAPKKSCHRLVDIVSFVPFVLQRIVPSTCRYRVIRAIRASRNRVIDLSISCPSYHSCSKKIVSSTCRYRIIRVIRALKYRVIDWSISCHSCLKISCHRLVDIVAFVSFVQDGIETFVPTKPWSIFTKSKKSGQWNFLKEKAKRRYNGRKKEIDGQEDHPSYRNVTILQVGWQPYLSWMKVPSQLNEGPIPIGGAEAWLRWESLSSRGYW